MLLGLLQAGSLLYKMFSSNKGEIVQAGLEIAAEKLGIEPKREAVEEKLKSMAPSDRSAVLVEMEKTAQARIAAEGAAWQGYLGLLEADVHSKSWLSRNVRPMNTLAVMIELFALVCTYIIGAIVGFDTSGLTDGLESGGWQVIMLQLAVSGVVQYRRTDEKAGTTGALSNAIGGLIAKK